MEDVLKSTLSSAWLRDMTGLSNHALSAAEVNPLAETLDARPTGMDGVCRVKVNRRSGSTKPDIGARAARMTTTIEPILINSSPSGAEFCTTVLRSGNLPCPSISEEGQLVVAMLGTRLRCAGIPAVIVIEGEASDDREDTELRTEIRIVNGYPDSILRLTEG